MFPSMRYVASIASGGLLFLLIWLMLPSATNPEDVVRNYLGHLRHSQIGDNFHLVSSDVRAHLRERGIDDEYDYFDMRLGEFPVVRKYTFLQSGELGDEYRITAEVRSATDPYARIAYGEGYEAKPPIDTLTFLLVQQDGDWRVDQLRVGEMALLP